MRINAYVLAADPTWIRTSVLSYYHHVERIVVSYDQDGRGWTGSPIDVEACLSALREIDSDSKLVFAPGTFHDTPSTPLEAETRQRRKALEAAETGADWVLQIDTDEAPPDFGALREAMYEADRQQIPAVEWPMRVLYRRLGPDRYLEIKEDDGRPHVEYPGAVAVRRGTKLVDCRRTEGPYLRVMVDGADSLQLRRPPGDDEHRLNGWSVDKAIVHNSWARSPVQTLKKVTSWGHATPGTMAYFAGTWLASPLRWQSLRDLHPFARGLWPRLGPSSAVGPVVHPGDNEEVHPRVQDLARDVAKHLAPSNVVSLVQWRRDSWGDLRLRLLSDIGYLPSHRLRNAIYRRAGMKLPASSSVHWRAQFYAPERIVIGEGTTIGDSVFLDGRSGLVIGDNVNLGSHVTIWTRQHDIDDPDFAEVGGPVKIHDYAYLGSQCTVLPGVTVGEGGVVAAGAVVTHDVPEYTLVAGVPARTIRPRARNLRYRLGYAKRFV